MPASFSNGDFSRATHLSIKTLRHYHGVGLLEPADVDPASGHRRYTTNQIPIAQVIRRFRSLDMPLDEIRAVLAAPDVATRNDLIAAHLDHLQANLTRTQEAVASLRALLEPAATTAPVTFEHRTIEATPAATIREIVDIDDLSLWFEGAFGEIYATLTAQQATPDGPGGGIYANDLFANERGEATVFVPCNASFRPSGRVEPLVIPAVELAITVHAGAHADADRTYGALAAYVADHALAVDGPIREYYLTRETERIVRIEAESDEPRSHLARHHPTCRFLPGNRARSRASSTARSSMRCAAPISRATPLAGIFTTTGAGARRETRCRRICAVRQAKPTPTPTGMTSTAIVQPITDMRTQFTITDPATATGCDLQVANFRGQTCSKVRAIGRTQDRAGSPALARPLPHAPVSVR